MRRKINRTINCKIYILIIFLNDFFIAIYTKNLCKSTERPSNSSEILKRSPHTQLKPIEKMSIE